MPRPSLIAFFILLICSARASGQEPDTLAAVRGLEQALVDAIAHAERSVVSIARVDQARLQQRANPLDPFGLPRGRDSSDPEGSDFIPDEFGSGVLVENPKRPDERFVLTTCHVAFREGRPQPDANIRIYVRLASRHVMQADAMPVAADPRSDLAVLRLQLGGAGIAAEEIPALPLGRAEELQKGRFVVALGNPYAIARDGSASASIGIVSNISRRPAVETPLDGATDDDATIHEYGTLLQVDTRLNLGTSGGALLNLDGELVGITTALAALEGYEKSVGYAIPLDEGMRRVVSDLLDGYEAEYGFLGIAPQVEEQLRLPGVAQPSAVGVNRVATDSPAYQAGLKGGDIILAINGRTIYDVADLMRIIGLQGPGAEAQLSVWRETERLELHCVLGKWPVYDDTEVLSTAQRFPEWRGLQVDYSTARKRFLPSDPLERYRRAVVVTSVAPDSPAARAGVQPGDFIKDVGGESVQTPAEFAAAVASLEGRVSLTRWTGERIVIGP
jgi:serine protease Do